MIWSTGPGIYFHATAKGLSTIPLTENHVTTFTPPISICSQSLFLTFWVMSGLQDLTTYLISSV